MARPMKTLELHHPIMIFFNNNAYHNILIIVFFNGHLTRLAFYILIKGVLLPIICEKHHI